MGAQILVVDDEGLIRQSLQATLSHEGFETAVAGSLAEGWHRFSTERPDVVVLDLVLGDGDGLDLLRRIKRDAPETKILVITAHGSIESAVAAMKEGAYDFVKKPFDLDEIITAAHNALRTTTLERRVDYLSARDRKRVEAGAPVCASEPMQRLVGEASLIASHPVPLVLVVGESGSGKQVIARMLHDRSDRAAGSFVELNCSALPESLLESELFGYERGAFSDARERKLGLVEVADGGSLFLDEIGDLGQAAQAKLLTFLEQRSFRRLGATTVRRVDTRIIAATNRDLSAMVKERSFREDLWYRLNAMTLRVPPLRERQGDIGPLGEHFLAESSRQFRRRWAGISPEALGILCRYPWPGNVRELRAVISRAALLHDDERIEPRHLPADLITAALAAPEAGASGPAGQPGKIPTLEEVELAHIRRVLEVCAGNRTLAAQHLGITRQTLARKIGGGAEDS
jgi:DNA-binding NtrC family response regulator